MLLNASLFITAVKVGVTEVMPTKEPAQFLLRVADAIAETLQLQSYLFALISPPSETNRDELTLLIVGTDPEFVEGSSMLATAKFTDRLQGMIRDVSPSYYYGEDGADVHRYLATLYTPPSTPAPQTYDIPALHDILRKATFRPLSPTNPPPSSYSSSTLLSMARSQLQRITPEQALEEVTAAQENIDNAPTHAPTFIVDIRSQAQKESHGRIHGGLDVERNDLPWLLDPSEKGRRTVMAKQYDVRWIVMCQTGDASSLAAKELTEIGLLNATDMVGGFSAWKRAGLPVTMSPP